MSQIGPDFPDIKRINAELFSDIDPEAVKDNAYVEKVQQNCINHVNPFACYVTILLGKEPKVTWRHNTGAHFGLVDLQFEDLLRLIHPSWLFTYIRYGKAMYEVVRDHKYLFKQEGSSASRQIPMRHRSGKYFWYHQIAIKVAEDGDNLAAHLNYYQKGSPYEAQLPAVPQIATAGEVNMVVMKSLHRQASLFLPEFLSQFLSETQVNFMLQYRAVIQANDGKKVVRGELLALINDVDTLDNLNKLKQRIKRHLQDFFKHPSLDSAYALAIWLNRYFPLDE